MTEWQPIETIPHDGDEEDRQRCGLWAGPVLVYLPDEHGGVMLVAQCDAGEWIIGDDDQSFAALTKQPTHWMPLPEPPK